MKYDVGDIVFVAKYNKQEIDNHLFVIIGDDNQLVPMDYFGMVVSSNISKSKDKSKFKYNEPLNKNSTNGLNVDSIVKCDNIYNIPSKNIQFKIGTIDADDYIRFMNSFSESMN